MSDTIKKGYNKDHEEKLYFAVEKLKELRGKVWYFSFCIIFILTKQSASRNEKKCVYFRQVFD